MKWWNSIIAIILCLSGLLTIFVIIPFQTTAGERYGLSPAFFPTCSMVILTLLSALLLLKSLFGLHGDSNGTTYLSSKNWIHISLLSVLLIISVAVMKYLGFILGGIFTISSFMIYMRERKLIVISMVSIIIPVFLYLILWKFLRFMLP